MIHAVPGVSNMQVSCSPWRYYLRPASTCWDWHKFVNKYKSLCLFCETFRIVLYVPVTTVKSLVLFQVNKCSLTFCLHLKWLMHFINYTNECSPLTGTLFQWGRWWVSEPLCYVLCCTLLWYTMVVLELYVLSYVDIGVFRCRLIDCHQQQVPSVLCSVQIDDWWFVSGPLLVIQQYHKWQVWQKWRG